MSARDYRIAIVGATGQVGTLMLRLLRERGFPAREIVPFASERSAGRVLDGAGAVQLLSEESIRGFDLALFSAGGATSGEWAPRFAEAGAVVVDNSSRWRMQDDVPLVVAEVNPESLVAHRGIIANPNCSTMQMVVALFAALRRGGHRATCDLHLPGRVGHRQERRGGAAGAVPRAAATEREIAPPQAYRAHQIAFNVLPHAGSFAAGEDHTDEERKLMNETRKILGDEAIRVSATCVRVPVVTGHSEAVNVQTRDPLTPERARELLSKAPGIVVLDDPGSAVYPLAIDAAERDEVLVGRIRRDPGNERALDLWIVADNLRKGAATNAVQIAEALHERDLIAAARERTTV